MNTPDSRDTERYEFAGKGLGDLLLRIRDHGAKIPNLKGVSNLCNRIYILVYDEGLTLKVALDEIGRQTSGQLYGTRFWAELTDNIPGDASLPNNDVYIGQILVSYLERICNEYFTTTDNPEI